MPFCGGLALDFRLVVSEIPPDARNGAWTADGALADAYDALDGARELVARANGACSDAEEAELAKLIGSLATEANAAAARLKDLKSAKDPKGGLRAGAKAAKAREPEPDAEGADADAES